MKRVGIRNSVVAAIGMGILPMVAHAQTPQNLKLEFLEVGGNVVGTASGSFNLNGLTDLGNLPSPGEVTGSAGSIWQIGTGTGTGKMFGANLLARFVSGHPLIGTTSSFATSDTGDPFAIHGSNFIVPRFYGSGTAASGSSTWAGATFASLNLNPGTWIWDYGTSGDTVTLQVGASGGTTGGGGAVPEPGEWAAMGILGAGLTGLVLRKRRKA